jgi:protein involved in polysaccharide export with SLBB domain
MKTVISVTLFASLVLASFISVAAQETAGAIPVRPALNNSAATAKAAEPLLTEIYRVGVGDVLDVRLMNSPNNRSTLFTVMPSGAIDFPIAGGAIMVAGETTDEIQARLAKELKRRAVDDKAQVSVGVRQYVSHSIMITGLVVNPGTRLLRREAVPLYVVLSEAQLRNDAGRVVIMRGGTTGEPLALSDPQTLNVTVQSGDVITVSMKPQEFYYIAGRVTYPGQKAFQPGITLLQAILAAGGTARPENRVEISRAGADGRLSSVFYRIRDIKAGTVEDPKLQAGDRIEISK